MTPLSTILTEIGELGCRNPKIQQNLLGWVNRAQRSIAQRRNWTWMHSQQTATITAGNTSANLSARFKELSPERSPITFTAPGATSPTPVQIKSRAELEGLAPGADAVVTAGNYYSPYYVFLEQNDAGLWTINTAAGYIHAANSTYAISCYLYPADLSAAAPTNALTDDADLVEALIAKTRSMAYLSEDSADQRGIAAMQQAQTHIAVAAVADAHRRLAGRRLHW